MSRLLQASQDLSIDLAAVIKLGVNFSFEKYWERIAENKRGDAEEENKRSIALLFLSLTPSLPDSFSIYLYIYLSFSHSLYPLSISISLSIFLNLSIYLSISISIYI